MAGKMPALRRRGRPDEGIPIPFKSKTGLMGTPAFGPTRFRLFRIGFEAAVLGEDGLLLF